MGRVISQYTGNQPIFRKTGMSEPTILQVAAQVHGRTLVREASESPAPLLIGFHGYGQNGEKFLEAVCEIPGTPAWHVAAIQALHPFYDRKTGAVVASWMTSQDRDLAISDNIGYVTRAIDEIRKRLSLMAPTVFLGFSQGTAMAYRAAWFSNRKCDGLIALAGDAPSDEETASALATPAQAIPRVLIGRGVTDTWYDEDKLGHDVAQLERMGSIVETCVFEGGHEWTDEFRTVTRVFLDELSAPSQGKT